MKQVITSVFLLLFLSACIESDSEPSPPPSLGTSGEEQAELITKEEPVTAPPVAVPPVTAPPVTAPPVAVPPVTAPPVAVPPVTVPPVAVPPVTAPAIVVAPVLIEWLDNSDNEDGFIVERKAEREASFTKVNYLMPDATHYIDDSLLAGIYYCYRVIAFNQAGSTSSDEVCIDALYK
ncbi:fibronectin type III domain-containing protein [Psychromonas hadalis]|uniref:fibronectin type III domain-containing protein n=1 Tax=Psychromonas hadalis TaxID=211669 RepID=UPI0003B6B6AB|nr:fibronectin type III domain-containing protein [Psychromonas hadalis]